MKPFRVYKSFISLLAVTISAVFLFYGCGGGDLPVEKIKKALKDTPTYSIILEDMKEDGNFFKDYYHKYEVVQEKDSGITDWLEVPEDYYRTNQAFLGMTLVSKKDGKLSSDVSPPGYRYVGDSRYGRWRTDHRGSSFWEFYGKYAMFSALLGSFNRPIYRDDYNMYNQYRSRNMPYYGRNNEYGTNGSITKKTKPDFYSRKMASQRSFKDRVKQRTGRTRTGYRGRSGRVGK
jgi:hypothetical protein